MYIRIVLAAAVVTKIEKKIIINLNLKHSLLINYSYFFIYTFNH